MKLSNLFRDIVFWSYQTMAQAPSQSVEEADAFQNLVQEELGDNLLPVSKIDSGTEEAGDGLLLPESSAVALVERTTRTPFDRDDERGRSSLDGRLWKGAGGSTFAVDSDAAAGKDAIQEASRARAARIRQRDETERETRQKTKQAAAQEWSKLHQSWDKACQEKRLEAKKRQEKLQKERDALLDMMLENADRGKPAWPCVRALLESGGSGSTSGRSLATTTASAGKASGNAVKEEEGLYRTSRARMKEVIYSSGREAGTVSPGTSST
jgi:hypothetical protein